MTQDTLEKQQQLHSLAHLGPICALKCLNNELILAGDGPVLKIYNYSTSQLVFQRQIFARNKIHEICLSNKNPSNNDDPILAIFGGRSLSIVKLSALKSSSTPIKELFAGDWIMATEFSHDKKELYCLTAHNNVTIIDLTSMKLKEVLNCNWKSILYSGSIRVLSDDKILVCAGTVMDGVLIWDLKSREVVHHLTAHEGSIFGVKASENGKYLLSCSDDRSIKVWDLQDGGRLVANGWGHGARIWFLDFYGFTKDGGFHVFSASEDCTTRIWRFDVGNENLNQLSIMNCHTGRNIWSGCVNDELKLGFTGGADGKLKVYDLNEQGRQGYLNEKWSLKQIGEAADVAFAKDEIIKEYFDLGNGFVGISSLGKVLVCQKFVQWKFLFEDSRYTTFSLVRGFENQRIAAISNKEGNITLLKFDADCNLVHKNELKVDSLSRVNNLITLYNEGRYFFILESPNPNDFLLLKEIDNNLTVINEFKFVKPKEKVVIASFNINSKLENIIIGCRFGIVLMYDLSGHDNTAAIEPSLCHKKYIKGDTITSIKTLSKKDQTYLLTMKDSGYYVIQISSLPDLIVLEDNKIQKGFVDGGFYSPDADLILYGFKSDYFFIWNETQQFEIMRKICGGPHRQWSLAHHYEGSNLRYRFIFTRSSDIELVQNGKFSHPDVLATGLHGREIRDMSVVATKNPTKKLLITGSEDTTIKVSTLTNDGNAKLHWSQRQHGSGTIPVEVVN
ncbi:unnamed protein product [Ambrosiozyma monospora]|uniref:Unnamed protein product n=1 Tax=Ambrosiozyma monospora TaxID=43982 RepID=A0A9W6YVJ3_AMBMO|nr:unnamed protein product [Ambrosiozyma monospora]